MVRRGARRRWTLGLLGAALSLLRSRAGDAADVVNGVRVFNPNCTDNIVTHWGQNTVKSYNVSAYQLLDNDVSEPPLADFCADDTYDVINIALVSRYADHLHGLPVVNLAHHCNDYYPRPYENFLDCRKTAIPAAIRACQQSGKLVILKLQAVYNQSDTGTFLQDASQAEGLSRNIWNMYLGGSGAPIRPFGDVKLDGVDIAHSGGTGQHWAVFANALRDLARQGDPSKSYYISASAGCAYPDETLGPTGSGGALLDGAAVDWINLRFLGQADCGNSFFMVDGKWSFPQWANWAPAQQTRLVVGGYGLENPADAGGYVSPATLRDVAANLTAHYPDRFGGLMVWDASTLSQNAFAEGAAGVPVRLNFAQDLARAFRGGAARACGVLPERAVPAAAKVAPTSSPSSAQRTQALIAARNDAAAAAPTPTPAAGAWYSKAVAYVERYEEVRYTLLAGAGLLVCGSVMFITHSVLRWKRSRQRDREALPSASAL